MRMLTVTEQVRLASIRMLRGVFSGIGQLLLAADRFKAEEAATESGHADAPNGPQDPLSGWESRVAEVPAVTATIGDRDDARVRPEPTSAQAHPEPPTAVPGRRRPSSRPAQVAASDRAGKRGQSGPPRRKQGAPRPVAEQPPRRALDPTGNVRLLTSEELTVLSAEGATAPEVAALAKAAPANAASAKATPANTIPAQATPSKAAPAKATRAKATQAKATPAGATPAAASRSGQSRNGPTQAQSRPAMSPKAAPPPIPGYDDLSLASLRARLRGLTTSQLGDIVDYERSHANRDDVVMMFERRIAKLEAGDG